MKISHVDQDVVRLSQLLVPSTYCDEKWHLKSPKKFKNCKYILQMRFRDKY